MSDEKQKFFTNNFEELLNKSIEANKTFINEGVRMFKQFSNREKPTNLNVFQNDLLTKTFNEYVKLNVTHFNNLMDLGLNFVKNINPAQKENQETEDISSPSFVLEKTVTQGESVSFQFLLDNVKKETVKCQLIHSGYSSQTDPSSVQNFKTVFTPQSFELSPGESKPVSIQIDIPVEAPPGNYSSKVQVKGFEPSYFSIQLTVIKNQKKASTNVRKKATPKRKK
jgi:uncharacterized membrane protein